MKLMEPNYNIGFTVGDLSGNGHCLTKKYHLITNHSVKEITEAYKEISKELNWEFLKEYQECFQYNLSKEGVKHLLNLGIINLKDFTTDFYTIYDIDKFVEIFFELIKTKIPDLIWENRNLNEDNLDILNDTGYGLFIF